MGRATDGRRLFLLDRRGWARAAPGDGGRISEFIRPVPGGGRIVVELEPGVFAGWPDGAGEQTVTAVRVESAAAGSRLGADQVESVAAGSRLGADQVESVAAGSRPGDDDDRVGVRVETAAAGSRPGDDRAGIVRLDPVTFSETVRDLFDLVT